MELQSPAGGMGGSECSNNADLVALPCLALNCAGFILRQAARHTVKDGHQHFWD